MHFNRLKCMITCRWFLLGLLILARLYPLLRGLGCRITVSWGELVWECRGFLHFHLWGWCVVALPQGDYTSEYSIHLTADMMVKPRPSGWGCTTTWDRLTTPSSAELFSNPQRGGNNQDPPKWNPKAERGPLRLALSFACPQSQWGRGLTETLQQH